jgi:hypothetical protein
VRAWRPIAAAGSRIVALADNPEVSDDSIACLTRVSLNGDRTGECGMSRAQALTRLDALIDATERVPAASLIDLTQYYCTVDRCPMVVGNVIVYQDTNHISATYMRTLAPAIVDGIRQALLR